MIQLLIFLVLSFPAMGDISGTVVGIDDGDSITVLDNRHRQTKVRLYCIDAPEKKMPYGQRAKKELSNLVANQSVFIKTFGLDKYGRTIGEVLHDGKSINLAMVEQGLAWAYPRYCKEQRFFEAEVKAKEGQRNMWSLPDPARPWEWRHLR
jgi:endonuclease YncB( thermonuclease family)